jgi:hypothetical protein
MLVMEVVVMLLGIVVRTVLAVQILMVRHVYQSRQVVEVERVLMQTVTEDGEVQLSRLSPGTPCI